MHHKIQEYVSSYASVKGISKKRVHQQAFYNHYPILCHVWDNITMNFIKESPFSNGKGTILVVIDRLSKYTHFVALTHPYTAKMVAKKFIDSTVKLHGMLCSIINDRDLIFISHFWQEFFKMSGTKIKISFSYHPQTNEQT